MGYAMSRRVTMAEDLTDPVTLRVRTSDGVLFQGHNARAVVRQMRDACWNAPNHKSDYMAEVQRRVKEMTGKTVPTTAGAFLRGLVTLKLAVVEEGHIE